MALSFIEGTLTIPGLLPGMKLGLANIVVMYALFFMGPKQALVLDALKALFVFLVSGFTAGFLSLCGGLLSLLVMWVLYYLLPVRPTWFILSVCGALTHNVGQLLGAGVIISSSLSFYYAPVMLVLGLVMGALTSVTLKAILPALGKWAFPRRKSGERTKSLPLGKAAGHSVGSGFIRSAGQAVSAGKQAERMNAFPTVEAGSLQQLHFARKSV